MLDSHILFSSDMLGCRLEKIDDDAGNLSRVERCKTRLIRVSLAESCFKSGKMEKADALFRGWLNENPDWEWGWIAWSDCYWLWDLHEGGKDIEKAERILKEALSIPGLSSKKHVNERYRKLQQKKRSMT